MRANILAMVIMLPFAAAIAVPYILQHGIGRIGSFNTYLLNLVLFIILAAVEMALHEGIHGLTWHDRQNIIKNHCSRRNIGKEKS